MKKKNDKKKKGLIIAIFLVAILMAVGYAALQAELTINAVGKIYSDWDVEFTESTCDIESAYNDSLAPGDISTLKMECLAEADEYDIEFDHLDLYTGGIVDDEDDNKGATSGVGGIELALYTEFATPEDVTTFTIEITNFSSMWDAVLKSITHINEQEDSDDTDDYDEVFDWILYKFDGIYAFEGTINQVGGDKGDGTTPDPILATDITILKAIGTFTAPDTDNIVTFDIIATWNPDYDEMAPRDAIKKEQEAANYALPDTDANYEKQTYIQVDKFVLLWEAYKPGGYTYQP